MKYVENRWKPGSVSEAMKRKFLQVSEISRHDDSILENFNKMESSCKFPRKIVKIVPF